MSSDDPDLPLANVGCREGSPADCIIPQHRNATTNLEFANMCWTSFDGRSPAIRIHFASDLIATLSENAVTIEDAQFNEKRSGN
jgi:hypothetical protein